MFFALIGSILSVNQHYPDKIHFRVTMGYPVMPDEQEAHTGRKSNTTTKSVSRRRWLQIAGIGVATGVLASSRASATSTELPNAILIEGSTDEGTVEYELLASDQVRAHPDVGGHEPTDGLVEGTVETGRVAYEFSGTLSHLDVNNNGKVTLQYGDISQPSDREYLYILPTSDSDVDYEFASEGKIRRVLENGDRSTGDETDGITETEDGWIVDGSTANDNWDMYELSGGVEQFEPVDEGTLFLDGEEVTAEELIDQAGQSGDGSAEEEGSALGGGAGYDNILTEADADYVASSRSELGDALSSASSGEVVFVESDAEISMNNASFDVSSGVTLASDRGNDGSDGALLYTERGSEPSQLFRMDADSRITGIRMSGPWAGGANGNTQSNAVSAVASGVEIDNCDIGQFSYAGVNLNNGEAHVHHNVIYENNRGGLGYGVTMSNGQPVIEYNYFNFNRHSVASTGGHRGYICRFNHFGPDSTGGVIDIHQPGGVESAVHNNVVEATVSTSGHREPLQSIQIRGTPGEAYDVSENWFWNPLEPRSSPGGWTNEAVIQATAGSWTNVDISDNEYGEDAEVSYGDVIPGYDGHWS